MDNDIGGHRYNPRRCMAADVLTVSGDSAEMEAFIRECDNYFSNFAAPVKDAEGKAVCFHCGGRLDGFMQALGFGSVAYEWGLAHGEAQCSGCGWPARGMHYPKRDDGRELFKARNLFLAYHPDLVEKRAAEKVA